MLNNEEINYTAAAATDEDVAVAANIFLCAT